MSFFDASDKCFFIIQKLFYGKVHKSIYKIKKNYIIVRHINFNDESARLSLKKMDFYGIARICYVTGDNFLLRNITVHQVDPWLQWVAQKLVKEGRVNSLDIIMSV